MAYGDYDGPDKPNKGQEGGACNRQSCQAEPANWYNHGSHAWYCDDCKRDIGDDPFNKRDWEANYQPRCGHLMFQTREQMDADISSKIPKPVQHEVIYEAPPVITEFRMEKRERQAPRPRDQYKNRKRF